MPVIKTTVHTTILLFPALESLYGLELKISMCVRQGTGVDRISNLTRHRRRGRPAHHSLLTVFTFQVGQARHLYLGQYSVPIHTEEISPQIIRLPDLQKSPLLTVLHRLPFGRGAPSNFFRLSQHPLHVSDWTAREDRYVFGRPCRCL